MNIREDLLLVDRAYRLLTGGNVHRGIATIQAYRNAIDLVKDPRCKDRSGARKMAARCEMALRQFVAPSLRVAA